MANEFSEQEIRSRTLQQLQQAQARQTQQAQVMQQEDILREEQLRLQAQATAESQAQAQRIQEQIAEAKRQEELYKQAEKLIFRGRTFAARGDPELMSIIRKLEQGGQRSAGEIQAQTRIIRELEEKQARGEVGEFKVTSLGIIFKDPEPTVKITQIPQTKVTGTKEPELQIVQGAMAISESEAKKLTPSQRKLYTIVPDVSEASQLAQLIDIGVLTGAGTGTRSNLQLTNIKLKIAELKDKLEASKVGRNWKEFTRGLRELEKKQNELREKQSQENYIQGRIVIIDRNKGVERLETKDEYERRIRGSSLTEGLVNAVEKYVTNPTGLTRRGGQIGFLTGKELKRETTTPTGQITALKVLDSYIKFNIFAPLISTAVAQKSKVKTKQKEKTKEKPKQKKKLSEEDIVLNLKLRRVGKTIRETTNQERLTDVRNALENLSKIKDSALRAKQLKNARRIFETAYGKNAADRILLDALQQEGYMPEKSIFSGQAIGSKTSLGEVTAQKSNLLGDIGTKSNLPSFIGFAAPQLKKLPELATGIFAGLEILKLPERQKIALKSSILSIQDTQTKTDVLQDQITRTKQVIIPSTTLSLNTNTLQTQELKTTTITPTIKSTLRQTTPTIKPTFDPTIPPIFKTGSEPSMFTRVINEIKKQSYNVKIKPEKQKTFRKVNKVPLTKKNAKDLMAYLIDNSLAASGRIEKTTGKPKKPKLKVPSNYFNRTKNKYREFKISKGKRIPTPNQWIEKKNKRLDTRAEINKITLFKQIANITPKRRKKKR